MSTQSTSQAAAVPAPLKPTPNGASPRLKPVPPPPPEPMERPSAIRRMIEARRQRRVARLAKLAPPIIAAVTFAESRPAHAYMGDQLLQTAATYFIAPLFILSVVCAGVASLFRPDYVRVAAYSAFICVAVFTVIKLAQPLMSAVSA